MNDYKLILELRRLGGKSDGPNRFDDAADALLAAQDRIRELETALRQIEKIGCFHTCGKIVRSALETACEQSKKGD